MSRFFEKFTLYELVLMAVMAALGIAIKPIVVPLAHIVCGPLMIPSGALAGGLYMMWLVIGYGMVRKPGTALIISVIQALLVIFTGIVGSHGIMSLLTYILPGLAVELTMIVSRHRGCCLACCALAGLFANAVGTATVNIVFFQAPGVYLILILALSSASGLAGGILAWELIKAISKLEDSRAGSKGPSGWVEDLDLLEQAEADGEAEASGEEKAETKGRPAPAVKSRKWIAVLAAVLLLTVGITAFINSGGKSDEDGQLTVLVEGEAVASFEMKEVMKMDSVTEYVDLSSGSKEDATGNFTGVPLDALLFEAGVKLEGDSLSYGGKEYSTALLTAGDGYSSAADADEAGEVLIAYELEGEPLGYFGKGGTGPLRAIFTKDTYGNRSVMNIIKIDLR